MSDKKFTLEEILDEYSPDRSKVRHSKKPVPEAPSGKMDTQQMLSDITGDKEDQKNNKKESAKTNQNIEPGTPEEVQNVVDTVRQEYKERRLNERPLKPVHNIQPDSLLRSRISFINSSAMQEDKTPVRSDDSIEGYDGAVMVSHSSDDHVPMIRRMDDSTRAKELKKKKGRKNKKESSYSYKRETPEGMYAEKKSPEAEKKKRRKTGARAVEEDSKPIPFTEEKDIVEAAGVKKYRPRIDDDKFDIHSFSDEDDIEKALDISIEQQPEKKKKVKKNKKKKLTEEASDSENREAIKKDIKQLRSVIVSRIAFLFLLCALSVFISAANHFDWKIYDSLISMISQRGVSLLHTLLGTGSVFAAFPTVKYGFKRLFQFRSDCDTMPALAIISSTVSSALIAFTPQLLDDGYVHLFMPAAILMLIVNTFGKLLILNRASKNIRFISNDFKWYAMTCVENESSASTLTRGIMSRYPVLAAIKRTSYLTDFLKYTYSSDAADKFCRIASPIFTIISLFATVSITVLRYGSMTPVETASFALSLFTSLILLSGCMGISLTVNIPLQEATKKFSGRDGAILGYQSVEDFYDTNSVLLNAESLFPSGSVRLAGLKIISDIQIEENLFAASSLVNYAGSILKDVFTEEIASSNKEFYDVSNFKYEDSFGICGWINNKRVLLGNREMMINHNIEGLPTKAKEDEYCKNNADALYLAVSGNLSALFIIEFKTDKKVKNYLGELERNNIKIILKSIDFSVTIQRIRFLYGISEDSIKILPEKLHRIFDEETKKVRTVSSPVLCSGRLSSITRLIIGIKHIRQAASIGVMIQLISAILGLIIGIIYILMGAFSNMTASLIVIYQLLFTIITIFIVKLRKI